MYQLMLGVEVVLDELDEVVSIRKEVPLGFALINMVQRAKGCIDPSLLYKWPTIEQEELENEDSDVVSRFTTKLRYSWLA